jgi:hypothetical protein
VVVWSRSGPERDDVVGGPDEERAGEGRVRARCDHVVVAGRAARVAVETEDQI